MIRCAIFALALAATAAAARDRPPVTVSGAASLAEVLQELAAEYESRTGTPVVLNVAASNTLARQIAAGARVDVFVSADEAQMASVAPHVDPASLVHVASNQLAIAVARDSTRRIASPRDLADPAVRRIAIGDPAAVPAGVYARAYLRAVGVWDAVAPKIVPSGSVRLALAAVEHGGADAAIVYRTDIRAARRAREALVVPTSEGPRILYPAAVVRAGRNPSEGKRFLVFLADEAGQAVFARAGFLRP